MANNDKKLTEDKAAITDKASSNDDNKKSAGTKKTNEKFVALRDARLGSNKDGSPKIEIKRGQDLGTLSKDDQELYRKHKIIK